MKTKLQQKNVFMVFFRNYMKAQRTLLRRWSLCQQNVQYASMQVSTHWALFTTRECQYLSWCDVHFNESTETFQCIFLNLCSLLPHLNVKAQCVRTFQLAVAFWNLFVFSEFAFSFISNSLWFASFAFMGGLAGLMLFLFIPAFIFILNLSGTGVRPSTIAQLTTTRKVNGGLFPCLGGLFTGYRHI